MLLLYKSYLNIITVIMIHMLLEQELYNSKCNSQKKFVSAMYLFLVFLMQKLELNADPHNNQ